MDVTQLSDVELKDSLVDFGVDVGPVTLTTRRVYQKKLSKLLASKEEIPIQGQTKSTTRRSNKNERTQNTTLYSLADDDDTPQHYAPSYTPSGENLRRRPLYTPRESRIQQRTTNVVTKTATIRKDHVDGEQVAKNANSWQWCRFLLPLMIVLVLLVILVYYHMEVHDIKKLPKP